MRFYQKFSLFLAMVTAIFIFYISSKQFPPTIPTFSYRAILYHFGIFFLLNLFIMIASFKKNSISPNLLVLILLISITYAALDELHQFFVPGRDSSIDDFAIDCTGILFSFILIIITKISRKN